MRRRELPSVTRELPAVTVPASPDFIGHAVCEYYVWDSEASDVTRDLVAVIGPYEGHGNDVEAALSLSLDGCAVEDLP